jgi:hypothetical protein
VGMKVSISGFELSFAKPFSLPEIYQLFESLQGKEYRHYSDKYIYYTDVKENFIVGVVLRFKKDKKSIATRTNENGDLVIDVSKLGEDEDNTEVSIFCMNPKTLKGVFYAYVGGMSVNILRTIWKAPHDTIKANKIKSLTQEYSRFEDKRKVLAKQRAESECAGFFDIKLLTTPATLAFMLAEFETIKGFEINAADALDDSGKYSPSSSIIKKAKVDVTFENIVSGYQNIKQYINKVITSTPTNSDIIKLHGVLAGGQEKTLYLGENVEDFGRIKFDTYVDWLPEELWKDYINCVAVDKLIYKMKNTDAVFGVAPQNNSWRLSSATTENKLKEAS